MSNIANRAYSAFEVKSLESGKRRFSGIASTPTVDRMLDSVNPLGVSFVNPLVLLHQHDRNAPIGKVWFDKPTKKGVAFEAEIPQHDEPGPLKDRLDTAWGEIALGIVRFVSIGFQPLKYAYNEKGGIDYQEISVYELSSVSIPALPEAVITSFKSMRDGTLPRDIVDAIKANDVQFPKIINGGYEIRPVRQEIKTLMNPDGSFRLRNT